MANNKLFCICKNARNIPFLGEGPIVQPRFLEKSTVSTLLLRRFDMYEIMYIDGKRREIKLDIENISDSNKYYSGLTELEKIENAGKKLIFARNDRGVIYASFDNEEPDKIIIDVQVPSEPEIINVDITIPDDEPATDTTNDEDDTDDNEDSVEESSNDDGNTSTNNNTSHHLTKAERKRLAREAAEKKAAEEEAMRNTAKNEETTVETDGTEAPVMDGEPV